MRFNSEKEQTYNFNMFYISDMLSYHIYCNDNKSSYKNFHIGGIGTSNCCFDFVDMQNQKGTKK